MIIIRVAEFCLDSLLFSMFLKEIGSVHLVDLRRLSTSHELPANLLKFPAPMNLTLMQQKLMKIKSRIRGK